VPVHYEGKSKKVKGKKKIRQCLSSSLCALAPLREILLFEQLLTQSRQGAKKIRKSSHYGKPVCVGANPCAHLLPSQSINHCLHFYLFTFSFLPALSYVCGHVKETFRSLSVSVPDLGCRARRSSHDATGLLPHW
jgi:hypothetical protein